MPLRQSPSAIEDIRAILVEVRVLREDVRAMRTILEELAKPVMLIEPTDPHVDPATLRPGPFLVRRPFGVDGVSVPTEGGGITTLTLEEFRGMQQSKPDTPDAS